MISPSVWKFISSKFVSVDEFDYGLMRVKCRDVAAFDCELMHVESADVCRFASKKHSTSNVFALILGVG